jgi:hypothetical protein
MRIVFLSCFIVVSVFSNAQYKTFRISDKGDTLNAVDMKGQKQGKWIVRAPALRGEPGYEEEGIFVNDLKEGTWRRFNLMGDPIAIENYRWGNKNGISRYYTIEGLEREENWRAINPGKAYDTIDVVDPVNPNKYEKVVVKNEGASLRHGTWRYFYPPTGKLLGTENYFLDKLREPGSTDTVTGLVKVPAIDTAKAKPKPKEVLDFEKKTSGKKKALREGRTGG